MTTTTTAHSEAQMRVVTIKTDTGDLVKYSGNPAELPGARLETRRALRRAGAFSLLIQYNASRLKNGIIATEDLDTISLVTQVLEDPAAASYSFEQPCPDTAERIASINSARSGKGQAPYKSATDIGAIPDKLLKLAIPNKHEVSIEALAYALTQLSIFEDVQHANELLVACDYDGRKLGPLLDAIELEATGEDIALVTGTRDKFKEAGLKGQPLTFASFRTFIKQFNVLEYRCPPDDRLGDKALSQMVGSLFINDPSQRKNWSNHINQPVITSPSGARLSGPPRTYAESKALAEKVLRSEKVLAGIDELSSPSGGVIFDANQMAALSDANTGSRALTADAASAGAEALIADPRKSSLPMMTGSAIDVPRGEDGKYLYWAPPMSLCNCGTPDGGRHIKYKWPCAFYRKDPPDTTAGGGPDGGQVKGGKGKGRGFGKGKGKGGKGKALLANFTEEQIASLVSALNGTSTTSKTDGTVLPCAGAVSGGGSQSCNVANYDDDAELQHLLSSSSLAADLSSFFASEGKAAETVVLPDVLFNFESIGPALQFTDLSPRRLVGAELLVSNQWPKLPMATIGSHHRAEVATCALSPVPALGSRRSLLLWDVNLPQTVAYPKGSPGSFVSDLSEACVFVGSIPSISVVSGTSVPWFTHVVAMSAYVSNCLLRDDTHRDFPFRGSSSVTSKNYAFNVSRSSAKDIRSVSNAPPSKSAPEMPIFRAPIDSGCTANCTNRLDMLINTRPCNEHFNIADGKSSVCTAIGDMPVFAKDSSGKRFRFVLTDVRYVPDFKYTPPFQNSTRSFCAWFVARF